MTDEHVTDKAGAEVGFHESRLLPVMRGNARMARGAGEFEVPIFSRLTRLLWMGCSPAEFPDELEEHGYQPWDGSGRVVRWAVPVQCHWLYQGDPPMPRFDAILNLYVWGEYAVPDGVDYYDFEMFDSEDGPEKGQVIDLADWVIDRIRDGKRTLVHCQAGLNRSSLISAVVLMRFKKMSADEAINHIRERRSAMCLCNETFEDFLRSLA